MVLKSEMIKRTAWLAVTTFALVGCGNDEDYGFGGIYNAGITPGPSSTAATTYSGSGTLDAEGGTVDAGDLEVAIPEEGAVGSIALSASQTTLPAALPAGFAQVDDVVNISISDADQAKMNAPLTITMVYGDGNVSDEEKLLVLHYDATEGSYEAVRVLYQNTFSNKITFESRVFSDFVLVEVTDSLSASYDTGFDPATHGWNIANSGSYFAPDGNAFGMSGYAAWFYGHEIGDLSTKYAQDVALLTATRAQIAQNKTWPSRTWRNAQDTDALLLGNLTEERLGWLMKAYMSLLDEPLVLLFGSSTSIKQAAVVYAYDANGFKFYDVDVTGTEQSVSFNGSSFGTYDTYDNYGYAAITTLGRDEHFAYLTTEGENGFPGSGDINVTAPLEGAEIDAHQTTLTGSYQNTLAGETDLYVEVKGVGRQVQVDADNFSSTIEISSSTNTIVLLGGVNASTQSNWFKDAPIYIREVTGTLPASALVVTLAWEQNSTDVDLYITEPNDGETMWFGGHETTNGLTLDFDDTDGFGPEHGTLTTGESASITSGTVLNGRYLVRVHYYSDHDTGLPATGNVSIVVHEGEPQQESAAFEFNIATSSPGASGPSGTGDTWVDIAYVDIVNNVITPIAPEAVGGTTTAE